MLKKCFQNVHCLHSANAQQVRPQGSSVHFFHPRCICQAAMCFATVTKMTRWLRQVTCCFSFQLLTDEHCSSGWLHKKNQLHLSNGKVKRCWPLDDLDVHGKVNHSLSFPMVDDIHQLNSRAVYTPLWDYSDPCTYNTWYPNPSLFGRHQTGELASQKG